jgi:hypothetical protein
MSIRLQRPIDNDLGLLGFLTFGLLWTIGIVWWIRRPDRLELRTDIIRRVISARTSRCRSRGRATCTRYAIRYLATALADVNRDRVWTDSDQKRMWSRSGIVSAVFLLALIAARVLL